MPFDDTDRKPDLSIPTLEGLSYLLRHPEEWRNGFEWDFSTILVQDHECGTVGCALGVATLAWPGHFTRPGNYYETGEQACAAFGMTAAEAYRIFLDNGIYGVYYDDVTPAMVADAIDRYLEKKNAL